MENFLSLPNSCLICKIKINQIIKINCNHYICNKCIYILILYNKNSLEQFLDNIFEEEIQINCICQKGIFFLKYSETLNDFETFDSKNILYEDFSFNLSNNKINLETKIKLGLENLKQINNLIFPNNEIVENAENAKNVLLKICDGCENLYSSIYCYDCASFSCKDCFDKIHSIYKKFAFHRKTENFNDLLTSLQICNDHNKRFVYHCLTCSKFICLDCINSQEELSHEGHEQEYINDFFPTKINEILLDFKIFLLNLEMRKI